MKLVLKDGSVYEGESFGANKNIAGEVVFSTGMTGYVESFSDPSFAGQILVCTYPSIGNYGVPSPDKFESGKMQVAGLVVANYSEDYSHHDAVRSLSEWCKSSGVPAIQGVDTRAITKKLRERGALLGQLISSGKAGDFLDPNEKNLVAQVSPKTMRTYGKGPNIIILIDCGAKENIVRLLARPNITLKRVPWDYDFTQEKYDALVVSNGPGDPVLCGPTIEHIRSAIAANKPILGICLGNQLLALAAGASTFKLPFGHRGQNQPCTDAETDRCYITSQNHGFAIDESTLPRGWKVWFSNANDGSVEGIAHASKPWRSVQFHPEANPGPTDTAWIFEHFLRDHAKKV